MGFCPMFSCLKFEKIDPISADIWADRELSKEEIYGKSGHIVVPPHRGGGGWGWRPIM